MMSASRSTLALLTLCCVAACSSDTGTDSPASDGAVTGTSDAGGSSQLDASSAVDGAAADGSTPTGDAATTALDGSVDATTGSAADATVDPSTLGKFSFFVTSYAGLKKLSGSDTGFGGDLRFGETGDGAGLRGADKICAALAEASMPGATAKQWRAFLSTTTVSAKDRVGSGPWYDRRERLVAQNLTDLLNERPVGAAADIKDNLPNETGTPNHNPDGTGNVDNHDTLTGSAANGTVYTGGEQATCKDWTDATKGWGKPRVGHSWPRTGAGGVFGGGGGGGGSMNSWISALDEAGCGAGVNIDPTLDGPPDSPLTPTAAKGTVGSGGGYGGFYCFALTP